MKINKGDRYTFDGYGDLWEVIQMVEIRPLSKIGFLMQRVRREKDCAKFVVGKPVLRFRNGEFELSWKAIAWSNRISDLTYKNKKNGYPWTAYNPQQS